MLKRPFLLCLAAVAAALLCPRLAAAQLAPTGAHYAARPTDTGHSGPNDRGGYAASIPLDLPPTRGGLPVPIQIVSGSRGFGAAGLGWDVPLSFVHVDRSFARRLPTVNPGGSPIPRERVSLSLPGRQLEMVQRGGEWIARYAPEIRMREENGGWTVFDGNGLTYRFTQHKFLAGTGGPFAGRAGLWLLESIKGLGGAALALSYDIQVTLLPEPEPSLPSGFANQPVISINLISVSYNPHPTAGCFKHEARLNYNGVTLRAKPLSLSIIGERAVARFNRIHSVDVLSRASCGIAPERLRRYMFSYDVDPDVQQERLGSVAMYGRDSTPEATTPLPVARYTYASATVQGPYSRVLDYQYSQSIPLPTGAGQIAKTVKTASAQFQPPTSWTPHPSAATHSFMDITGDGRIDVVYQQNGKLWSARGVPSTHGTSAFAAGTQLNDGAFTRPVFDARSALYDRFSRPEDTAVNQEYVWTQTIDVNGDGRVDIIDAAAKPLHWVVYLNTPSGAPSGVKWLKRVYDVKGIHAELTKRGLKVPADYVPVSRRITGHNYKQLTCFAYSSTTQTYVVPISLPVIPAECAGVGALAARGQERTFVEWEVRDINGDGFVDVLFNSSPVGFVLDEESRPKPDPNDSYEPAKWVLAAAEYDLRTTNLDNRVYVALNVKGVNLTEGATSVPVYPFSAPSTLIEWSVCGVGSWSGPDPDLWFSPGSDLPEFQTFNCGFADINGDGLPDRIRGFNAELGTGYGFDTITLKTRWGIGKHEGSHKDCSGSNTTSSATIQTAGLRDLNGDGFPDLLYKETPSSGFVAWLGTGAGFVDPIPVTGTFALSQVRDSCSNADSWTKHGLYDIDGDGKPETVTISEDGTWIDVYALTAGTTPGIPEAGRLLAIDNGYGAEIRLSYRSAKEDAKTRHQVPYPEVVVDRIETVGTKNFGGSLAATSYAYGNIELFYDSTLDAFRPTGYLRRVEVTATSDARYPEAQVTATITDRYGLEPVNPLSILYMTDAQRFGRYLRVGRISDVTVLTGRLDPNAWAHLGVNIATDGRRIAGSHYDIDTTQTRLFTDVTPQPDDSCVETMFPYDYELSEAHNTNHYRICTARGFVYTGTVTSWRGSAAPPAASNIETLTSVRSIDDFGRVTSISYQNDAWRSDDDVCVDTSYATANGSNERVYSAIAARKVTNCAPPGTAAIVFAEEDWQYDKLPVGVVTQGLNTSHTVYRHATDTGAYLSTVREYDVDYDGAANPWRIVQLRGDGVTRTTTLAYEPFGLVAVRSAIQATGVPLLETSSTTDPVSDQLLTTMDENGTVRGSTYDGFGRPRLTTIKAPNGAIGVVSVRSYLGFNGADAAGRRVVVKEFRDPVDEKNIAVEGGHLSTLYLDELGRQRYGVVDLGEDYGTEELIVGERFYDPLGRVAFEADPYPTSQSPSTAYGTTQYFRADGFPWLSIRGRGPQSLNATPDASVERFPTLFQRTYANHLESTIVQTADALTSGSPQFGVTREEVRTAIGRVFARSTLQNGTRLELAQLGYDRLGALTKLTRFQNPAAASNPVEWTWQFDSRGQVLRLTEPSNAPQTREYSNWGELVRTTWMPSAPEPSHSVVNAYDAMGRLISSEEQNGGITDPATVKKLGYDAPVQASPHVSPTYVLGRLAYATAPTGTVSFSYDELGRVNARTFTAGTKDLFVEQHGFHADGSQAWLQLRLPDNNFNPERVDYEYDSAGRLAWMWSSDGANTQELFRATKIDAFGRLRHAVLGKKIEYAATHAETGRRLPQDIKIFSDTDARYIAFTGFDAVGREITRNEDSPLFAGTQTSNYDALGRLRSSLRTLGATTTSSWTFGYDPLGNILNLTDSVAAAGAWLSYQAGDRDRICHISYTGAPGPGCNVDYDSFGNTVYQPTRTGYNKLSYYNSGDVRSILSESGASASFRYDALGALQSLEIYAGKDLLRSDEHYGAHITQRYQRGPVSETKYLSRQFPGPGLTISRRGAHGAWIYQFSEARGTRVTTDLEGNFVQDLDYSPFGEASSKGSEPGTSDFSTEQWNDGDALEQFGLVRLGARLYDPVIGRFLSRDPLLSPRGAATSNPYGFSYNDPTNFADPTGLTPDPCGNCSIWKSYDTSEASTPIIFAAAVGAIIANWLSHSGSGQAHTSGPIEYQPIGPGLVTMWDTAQRSTYLSTIRSNAASGLLAFDEARLNDSLEEAELIARRVSAERNALRTATQGRLSGGGQALSEALDKRWTWNELFQKYGGENNFDTYQNIIRASGKSRGIVTSLVKLSKVSAPLQVVAGIGIGVRNVWTAPPERRAIVANQEVGAAVGGGVGFSVGTSMGVGAAGLVGLALASGPPGWFTLGFALAGGFVGGTFGSNIGREVGSWMAPPVYIDRNGMAHAPRFR